MGTSQEGTPQMGTAAGAGAAGALPPEYALRPATAADYAFLWDLHVATMRPYVASTWGWDESVQEQGFRRGFDPAQEQIIVVDGQDAGVLSVEERAEEVFLRHIEIAPQHQRRGLGTAVIGDILARAQALGLPVTLRVLHVNPARGLYERLGFRVTGRTTTHSLMRRESPPAAD
jgi:ribosomal protein S18 acetylase RimI-like enzyme